MEIRDINEIRSAIKYMDYKPVMLAKFYDIKSLLFKEILENEDYYKVASILPNPGNDNKIVKCVNILDKKYMAGRFSPASKSLKAFGFFLVFICFSMKTYKYFLQFFIK